MKALIKLKSEPGFVMTEAPIPELGPNDVLIKIQKRYLRHRPFISITVGGCLQRDCGETFPTPEGRAARAQAVPMDCHPLGRFVIRPGGKTGSQSQRLNCGMG